MSRDTSIEVAKKFEYIYFARAYFLLAYWGVKKVEEQISTGKFENPFGEIVPDWVHKNNYLLIPIIYNLKHGIEVAIKGLFQLMDEDFEKKHDLKILFRKIRQNKKINSDSIFSLEALVNKYYENRFLVDKMERDFTIEDKENDFFRYPDNKANIILDFFNILPRFALSDLEQIQSDIKSLEDNFYNIGINFLGPMPTQEEIEKMANQILEEKISTEAD